AGQGPVRCNPLLGGASKQPLEFIHPRQSLDPISGKAEIRERYEDVGSVLIHHDDPRAFANGVPPWLVSITPNRVRGVETEHDRPTAVESTHGLPQDSAGLGQ